MRYGNPILNTFKYSSYKWIVIRENENPSPYEQKTKSNMYKTSNNAKRMANVLTLSIVRILLRQCPVIGSNEVHEDMGASS